MAKIIRCVGVLGILFIALILVGGCAADGGSSQALATLKVQYRVPNATANTDCTVTVSVSGADTFAPVKSGTDGTFTIQVSKVGNYQFSAAKAGYLTEAVTNYVSALNTVYDFGVVTLNYSSAPPPPN